MRGSGIEVRKSCKCVFGGVGTPSSNAREIMALVPMEKESVLYCELKVAVPNIRGGRTCERGGWVGGILEGWREVVIVGGGLTIGWRGRFWEDAGFPQMGVVGGRN